jgi:hypothetical protein
VILLEPDVTLTDFAVAIECGIFAALLPRRCDRRHIGFVIFFAAAAGAALLGGVTTDFCRTPIFWPNVWPGEPPSSRSAPPPAQAG